MFWNLFYFLSAIFIYLIWSSLGKRLPLGSIIPIDYPGERKIHKIPTSCSGGIFIFFSFYICLIISFFLHPDIIDYPCYPYIFFIFCGMGILIFGLWDDHKDIKAHIKLVGQTCICLIAVIGGIKFKIVDSEILNIILNLFWFLIFINGMNLIDGTNGIASGITFIASMFLLFNEGIRFTPLASILCGAVLIFFIFNLSKKTFLGDSGSTLLGFLLAAISIFISNNGEKTDVLLLTILCFGVPIFDIITSIIRRLKEGKSIFIGDGRHIHHYLLKKGFSNAMVLLLLLGGTFILGCISLFMFRK
ncbi:MAG: MraY family glycosyltransferase [Nitrospirota bacterium]